MSGGSFSWLSASPYQCKGGDHSSQEYLPKMCAEFYPMQIFSIGNDCIKMPLKLLVIP